MTAPLGNDANRFTGITHYSDVTNTYGGYLTSAGNAYALSMPFTPDKFEWVKYTGYGTANTVGSGVWYRDFPAGAALVQRSVNSTTGTATSQFLEAANGVTLVVSPGGFYNEHLVVTGITAASPGVVTTSTDHGLVDNDRVVLTKIIGSIGVQLNNNTYVVRVLTATTFALYDVYGLPITTVGSYGSSGQVTKSSPFLGNPSAPDNPNYPRKAIIDVPPKVFMNLGSAVMGANNDVIYFTAYQFNNYVNRGKVI